MFSVPQRSGERGMRDGQAVRSMIEFVQTSDIAANELLSVLVADTRQHVIEEATGIRPRRLRVRIVRAEHQRVGADQIGQHRESQPILLKCGMDMGAEEVAGQRVSLKAIGGGLTELLVV